MLCQNLFSGKNKTNIITLLEKKLQNFSNNASGSASERESFQLARISK